MKLARFGCEVAIMLILGLTALPAAAQNAPAAARAADPAQLAAQTAFDALDLEARKQIQRDLAWVAKFSGGPTGEFGPLTYAAIRRFETETKSTIDGTLAPPERAALAAAADKARAAAGFTVQADANSGMKIGIPGKLFVKKSANTSGGARWQDKADKVTLDLIVAKGDEDLPAMFEKGTSAAVAGRKITYKLLRPDFFVIQGETDKGKFFRRMEKGADGVIRGFSLGYEKTLAGSVDPLLVPIIGSFEAQPRAAGSQVAARGPQAGGLASPPRGRTLTALVIAPERAIAAEAALKTCRAPFLAGSVPALAVEIQRTDPLTGLALISLPGIARQGVRNPPIAPLALAAGDAPEAATLLQRDEAGDLLVSPASLEKGVIGGLLVTAPLQEGGAGAALIDRRGALVAIVTAEPLTKFRVAGIVPVLRYRVADAAEIARFAGIAPSAEAKPERSTGELAAAVAPAIVTLRCAP